MEFTVPMQIANWQTITTPAWKPGQQLVDICAAESLQIPHELERSCVLQQQLIYYCDNQ